MAEFTDCELKEIIDGCVSNDRIAQEKLYKHYYNRMSALARSYISCPYKTEEIVNNGYLTAFKKIHQYNYIGSFEGWLRKIIFHAVADYVRNEKVKHLDSFISSDPYMLDYSKKSSIDNNNGYTEMCYKELLNLVDSLPSATSTIFRLYFYEGYTHNQISKIMNIHEGTSKWHLSEGRKKLREKITNLGLDVKF